MRATTPYAIGIAAAATWGLSPFMAGLVTACIVGLYCIFKLVQKALSFKGPTVIDPNDPPYRG